MSAIIPLLRASREQPYTLDPEEEESLWQTIGGGILSGIGRVGNLIDLPGSGIRDIIAGENPFDQWLSPFSGENRTTGAELLGYDNPDLFSGEGLQSLFTEMALDPMALLNFGASAATKAGQAAKKAGLWKNNADLFEAAGLGSKNARVARTKATPMDFITKMDPARRNEAIQRLEDATGLQRHSPAFNELATSPVGGGWGVKIPFGPQLHVGSGDTAAALFGGIGSVLNKVPVVGSTLSGSKNLLAGGLRAIRGLVDPSVKGGADVASQRLMPTLFNAETEAIATADRLGAQGTIALERAAATGKTYEADEIRRMLEHKFGAIPAGTDPDVAQAIGDFREQYAKNLVDYQNAGGNLKELEDDLIGYSPRRLAKEVPMQGGRGQRGNVVDVTDPGSIARQRLYTDVPGGTPTLNELAKKAAVLKQQGMGASDIAQMIQSETAQMFPGHPFDIWKGGDNMTPIAGRIEGLATEFDEMPVELLERGLYPNHPFVDAVDGIMWSRQATAHRQKTLDGLADASFRKAFIDPVQNDTTLPTLVDTLRDAKFNVAKALDIISTKSGVSVDDLRKMKMPAELHKTIGKAFEAMTGPRAANKLVKAWDGFTAMFKFGVLTWPSRFVRDFTSNMHRLWESGQFSLTRFTEDVRPLLKGNTVHFWQDYAKQGWVRRKLSDLGWAENSKNVTDVLRMEAAAHGLAPRMAGEYAGMTNKAINAGGRSGALESLASDVPGSQPVGWGDVFGPMQPDETLKLWRKNQQTGKVEGTLRGAGANESSQLFAKRGEHLGYMVESTSKLTGWLTQIGRGVDPATAAAKVKAALVDYTARGSTNFSRAALFRLFPFGRFWMGNTPWVVKQLMERPGGRMGQAIRIMRESSGQGEGPVPDYVAAGLSVPLPGGPEGGQRYLTGAGTMLEAGLQSFGSPMLEALSALNPLAKVPLELATDQSFFQKGSRGGRYIEDLYPRAGALLDRAMGVEQKDGGPAPLFGSPALEHIVSSSPISRGIGAVSTLVNPNKDWGDAAINLLTGARVTDITAAAQDAVVREQAQKLMRQLGAKSFERVYFSKDQLAQMDPQLRQQAQQLQALSNYLVRRSKERKEERERATL